MLPRLFLTILPVCSPNISDYERREKQNCRLLFEMSYNNTLSFYGRHLMLNSESDVAPLALQICNHPNLQVFDLRGNSLSVRASRRIAEALKNHPELKECLWSDIFTGRMRSEIPQLENLILNNNGLGLAGEVVGDALCALFRAALQAGTPLKLKKFVCGRNRLEVQSTISLTNAFLLIQTLEEIRLPQNAIAGEGIRAIATSIARNKNLRILDLNDNIIGPDASLDLAEAISELPALEELDLGDCVCDDPGILALLAGLEGCSRENLQRVILNGNNITSEIVDAIGRLFRSALMCHVQVDVSENMFGEDFERARATYGTGTNMYFGHQGNDDLPVERDEQAADDGSMEDDANTSRETVIDRSVREEPRTGSADKMLDDLVNEGFGCMRIGEDNKGVVSFLDQSLKLDSAESAQRVVQVINSTVVMKTLELRGNTLGIAAGNVIASAIERHPELERCLWSDLFTGRLKTEIPPILESLGKAIIHAGCKIRELDLSDNAFGPIGADALIELLESPSAYTLDTLKLNNNGLGIGGKQIAKSLTECLQNSLAVGGETRLRLKTFIAGRNRLENPGAHALAATFKSLETVEWFDVRQNGIHEEGIRALVAALKHNRNLRHLWLEDNTVLPKGAKALAKTLESWPKLEVLNLSDCLIRDAGCNYIVDHLNPSLHRQLKNVYLCGNELTPPTAKLIIQKWAKFDGLTPKPVLHIHTNSFGDEFDDVAAVAPENVNVGDEEDDLGSLDGDAEEYNSKSSDEADMESEGQDESSDDLVEIVETADSLLKKALERIEKLDIDFESRWQEETARVILQLAAPLKNCGMSAPALARAVAVAENIVLQVAAVKRNPIPATTQLINNIVAQCKGTGVKAELDWGYNADLEVISRLLKELLNRGHFHHERTLIQRFFPAAV
ncbi:unnamed protein product [Caenorhabditis sp. 36 PRJEB53466]|nr:unnamed protein product [Caenorhabditis sp. 36 PRJEB53466]